jgi:hypothetical protein
MYLSALFIGSKVIQKIICVKSKIYKSLQNALKIEKTPNYLQKNWLIMGIGGKIYYL